MPNNVSIENSFIGGLKTEYTGLNFPENACTDVDNCVFSLIGDIFRREGINYEPNNTNNSITSTGDAVSHFRWLNAGGDGLTQVLVVQIGATLHFFHTSAATSASPISAQLLGSTVTVSSFQAAGNSATVSSVECQYSAGNGYLFVYHPDCDPFYCTYNAGTIVANAITLQVRDFLGVYEPGVSLTARPSTLTAEHNYNLLNQGWTSNPTYSITPTTYTSSTQGANAFDGTVGSSMTFTVPSGLTLSNGEQLNYQGQGIWSGNGHVGGFSATMTVTSYSGTTLVCRVVTFGYPSGFFNNLNVWPASQNIATVNQGLINTWQSDIGNYPSNSDIWWEYKDDTSIFNPTVTINSVNLSAGQAPQGHILLNPFYQDRTNASGVTGITVISTITRPKTGAWFQGRVWYAGVDASQAASGDAQFYTWTESIYFSTIITGVQDFGACYQTNDATDENLNSELPSDGGVIVIQGSGTIYKLFPIQNGMLVFAANGVWFITGSSGIGFTATDYTITKISSVKSISGTSFIDVMGFPFFWNQEGIYRANSTNQGLVVEPLTVGTILTFYNNIPLDSKRYVRGDYDPISYVITWTYLSTQETGITNRYQFDSALSLNVFNKAFYPYSFGSNTHDYVAGVVYIDYPSGSLEPQFKYLTTVSGTGITFSEENDDVHWVDWYSYDSTGVNYDSHFVTGYKVDGMGFRKWQPIYVHVYSNNDVATQYSIQGIWDYATSGNTGRITTRQLTSVPYSFTLASGVTINSDISDYSFIMRRHKMRGHGQVLQIKVSSIQGQPFHIIGWAIPEVINTGS